MKPRRSLTLIVEAAVLAMSWVVVAPVSASSTGMAVIPAGNFTMGSDSDGSLPNEHPAHQVHVDGFRIDVHDVTNADFKKFVDATGYKTTAERSIIWDELKKQVPPGTPRPSDEMLQPGSMVFTPSDGPVDLNNLANWWKWVKGASWQHPEGPGSDLKGRGNYPVVQISWDDAAAYAKWAGKRLPTEAEWEYAAKGGLAGKRYGWGDQLQVSGKYMANTWTGNFPYKNDKADGFAAAAPVGSFPPNGYGLYDMGGNVWNWCSDWYSPDAYAGMPPMACCANPKGPKAAADPGQSEHVVKGGSFLCSPSYCESYRPSARRGEPADTGMSHIGFRCALSLVGTGKPPVKTASNEP